MIIVDTSVWIDYLKGSVALQRSFNNLLNGNQVLALSIVFGELLQGVKNKREKEVITRFWKNLPKINEVELFIDAGVLSNQYQLYSLGVGLIDCYILAAAIREDTGIWTYDKKLINAIERLEVNG